MRIVSWLLPLPGHHLPVAIAHTIPSTHRPNPWPRWDWALSALKEDAQATDRCSLEVLCFALLFMHISSQALQERLSGSLALRLLWSVPIWMQNILLTTRQGRSRRHSSLPSPSVASFFNTEASEMPPSSSSFSSSQPPSENELHSLQVSRLWCVCAVQRSSFLGGFYLSSCGAHPNLGSGQGVLPPSLSPPFKMQLSIPQRPGLGVPLL